MSSFKRMETWIYLTIACLGIFIIYWEITHQYAYLAPDSFTYFAMARNWQNSGKWLSYSGIDQTTGIHLGYYLLLLPFTKLAGWHLPAWSFIINGILLSTGIWFIKKTHGAWTAIIMSLGILTPYGTGIVHSGVESSLYWLAICYTAHAAHTLWSEQHPSKWQTLNLGLALGSLMIARLDSVFLVLATFIITAKHQWTLKNPQNLAERKSWALNLIQLGLPIVVIGTTIGTINYLIGGSPIPISGQLKSSFPIPTKEILKNLLTLRLFTATVLILGIKLVTEWRSHKIDNWQLAVWLACAWLWIYNGLFASGIGAWYGVLPLYGALLTITAAIQEYLGPRFISATKPKYSIHYAAGAALTVCIAIGIWHASRQVPDWITPHRVAASFMKQEVKAGETGAEFKDGIFAYYAPMPIFNLTGLANNQAYVTAARENKYEQYFKERSINYIIEGDVASNLQIPRAQPIFKKCENPILDNGFVRIFRIKNCAFRIETKTNNF